MAELSENGQRQSLKSQIYAKILKRVLDNYYPMNELIVEARLARKGLNGIHRGGHSFVGKDAIEDSGATARFKGARTKR